MLLTALYCAARLVLARTRRRPAERDVDLVHVLMGVAMAGMLAPGALLLAGLARVRAWRAAAAGAGWAAASPPLSPAGLVLQHRDGPGHGLHADHQPVAVAARYRSSAASRAVLCSTIGAG
jgi:hypothetical protein